MKINKKATSIAEAMVLMMIVVTGVTGMYKVYDSSVRLEKATNNKTIAINIAREGIEAMKNIRDTNWILYSSDLENCWNTFNYDNTCVGDDNGTNTDIEDNTTYKIYKNSQDRWMLSKSTELAGYTDFDYRTEHRVGLDDDGFYSQTGTLDNLIPLYTREIRVEYIDIGAFDITNNGKMEITSKVEWKDSTSTEPHKVELTQILSNWKK